MMEKLEVVKVMEMADEEFREYIASFDPTNEKKKYDDPNLFWTFRNYDKLSIIEMCGI